MKVFLQADFQTTNRITSDQAKTLWEWADDFSNVVGSLNYRVEFTRDVENPPSIAGLHDWVQDGLRERIGGIYVKISRFVGEISK